MLCLIVCAGLVLFPARQCSKTREPDKMESLDSPVTSVVKIEIDIAEETPLSWITPRSLESQG